MDKWNKIKELLLKYSYLGIEVSKYTGAILIGKAPHIGTKAWLNSIYPPIKVEELVKIEESVGNTIPDSYARFLTNRSNGLNILGDTLCLFGYRFNYIRDMNWVWQPYSIIELNKFEKPRNSTDDMFFIGGYDWDGSNLYMTPDGRVHFCKRYDSTSLLSWDSIYDMLISEIERLYTLFDSNGIQIDENSPTVPIS